MEYQQFGKYAHVLSQLYGRLEAELMRSVVRRFRLHREITGTIEWEMLLLAEAGSLTWENIEGMAKILAPADDALQRLVRESAEQALTNTDPLFQQAYVEGKLPTMARPVTMSTRLEAVYQAYYRQAADKLNLTNTTMLDSADWAYKDIINGVALKVRTGQVSRVKGLEQTIKEFAEQGLPALIDKANRKWSPEAYVNMVLRTTANNVSRDATFARMADWGSDLFFVSSHSGPRPLCEPYQGALCSYQGQTGMAKDLNGDLIPYTPLASTSFGKAAGLFGINCGHFPIVFIEGVSVRPPPLTEGQKQENQRVYQESQQQREWERRIRKCKRAISLYASAGLQGPIPQALEDLAEAQRAMGTFIQKTGRTRRKDREQIY